MQIQRHYLEIAEAHCGAPFMPPWADRVCLEWRKMLDRLENGAPGSVASTLDWAIKLALFLDRAEKRGVGFECWHHAYDERHFKTSAAARKKQQEFRLENGSAHVSPALLAGVYDELCEIDTRFGQLGGGGIFSALDRAGVLTHHVPGVDNIEHAIKNPPILGRASLRGQCVQRFGGQNQRYGCSWRHVVDHEKRLLLDISDPFVSTEEWQELPAGFRDSINPIDEHLRPMLMQARMCHDRGNHESAAERLRELEGFRSGLGSELRFEYLRLRAWVQSRRGFLDGVQALDELAESQAMNLSIVNGYVCCYRYQGLIPPRAIEPWIERGREFLDRRIDRSDGAALPFLGHAGYTLLRNGRATEALLTLQDACQPGRRECALPGAVARALADLGDAFRAVGHHSEAAALLDEAQELQSEHQLEGDLADFALTYRAKLETNPARGLELLGKAKAIQTRLGNVMGETRSLLLEARLLRNSKIATPLKARLHELRGLRPALSQCKLLAKILDHWDAWTNGGDDPEGGKDPYWWL